MLIGLVPAFIIAAVVAAWPVIRAIWWWLPELALVAAVICGWMELAAHTAFWPRLIITASSSGIPACGSAAPPGRLRAGLVPGQQAPRPGLLLRVHHHQPDREPAVHPRSPARPRPGNGCGSGCGRACRWPTSWTRLDKIAAACWAISVLADQASAANAALIRIDITRRDTLTGTSAPPLTAVLGGIIPSRKQDTVPLPTALDLPDITPERGHRQTRRQRPGPVAAAQQRQAARARCRPRRPRRQGGHQ